MCWQDGMANYDRDWDERLFEDVIAALEEYEREVRWADAVVGEAHDLIQGIQAPAAVRASEELAVFRWRRELD
jgi:hypothetical protein